MGMGSWNAKTSPGGEGLLRRPRGEVHRRNPTAGPARTLGGRWKSCSRRWTRSDSTAKRCATRSPTASSTPSLARSGSRMARTSRPRARQPMAERRIRGRLAPGPRATAAAVPEAGLEIGQPRPGTHGPRLRRGAVSFSGFASFGFWLELVASGLITGGIYAIVAIGLNLQYGLMRIMNISHGEFLMLGAFSPGWATRSWA